MNRTLVKLLKVYWHGKHFADYHEATYWTDAEYRLHVEEGHIGAVFESDWAIETEGYSK